MFKNRISSTLSRVFRDLPYVVKASTLYASAVLTFSLLTLLHPLEKMPYMNPEVIPWTTYLEPLFALAASIWSLNPKVTLMGIAFTVLFDIDHAFLYMGLPVTGRPCHSPVFIGLSIILLPYILERQFDRTLASVAAASGLTHIAFDIFEGGNKFPLLFPLTPTDIVVDANLWIPLYVVATILFASTRIGRRS